MDSNCQNGQNRRNAIWGIFYCEKRQKAVKNKVFEKIIAVGSVLVSMKKFEDKCIGCSSCGNLFCGSTGRSIAKNDEGEVGEAAEKSIFRRLRD